MAFSVPAGNAVAIIVQAEIDAGCYDYDLTVADPPVANEAEIMERQRRLQQLQTDPSFKSSSLLPRLATATTSTFPSGLHCVASSRGTKIHDLGWIGGDADEIDPFGRLFVSPEIARDLQLSYAGANLS